jgi:Flp pilus assembly protein TadD
MKPTFLRTLQRFFTLGLFPLAIVCVPAPNAHAHSHKNRHAIVQSTKAMKPVGDEGAHALLERGEADAAIAALQKILAAHPQDSMAHNLLCRSYYSEQRWPEAIDACQRAVDLQPENSEFHTWLGGRYGEAAEHASWFVALGLAR